MVTTYSRQPHSGSTNGRPIEVNAVASPGTEVHTVVATATTSREEIHLYAVNVGTASAELTVEFGGTTTGDQLVDVVQSRLGSHLMSPGYTLFATTSIVRAFATATGLFHIVGWVNRAT